jgi:phosphoenolpyruvate carboxylase
MSISRNSIEAFIQVLDSQSNLIPTQDWNELQQLSSQLPEDNEEIVEILENWLQSESRNQVLETYKQNLESITDKLPINVSANIGIANSKSQTTANQPSESSKELVDNAIKNNSPLSDDKKPQPKP